MADLAKLVELGSAEGIPPAAINDWYNQYGRDPAVQDKSEEQIIQAMALTKGIATTGKLQIPQRVEVTGSQKLPTQVNPYAGTTQEAANLETPNAASISQFDPAAMRAAQEAFNQKYAATQGQRTLANTLAGLGAGSTGGQSVLQNNILRQEAEKLLYDQTIGAQERLQKQATEGQAALTSAQAREVAAGEFTAAQRRKQNELDMQKLDVATRQRMNQPNSIETLAAKQLLLAQIAQNPSITPQALTELKTIIGNPNVTAEQLAPVMAQYAPAAHKAYMDKLTGGKITAEEEQARGLAAQAQAAAGKTEAETKVLQSGQPIREAAGMAPIPGYPSEGGRPTAPGTEKPAAVLYVPVVNPDGSITMTQGTFSQTAGRTTAEQQAEQQAQINNFNQVRGDIEFAGKAAMQMGGVLASGGKNVINYTNDKDVKKFELAVDKLNQEAIQLGLVTPSGRGVAGTLMGAAGAQASQVPGLGAIGTVMSATAPSLNGGQPVTTRTDPAVIRDLAYRVLEARDKQAALNAAQSQYARQGYGDAASFVNTEAYKKINNRVIMINPKTGDYAMVDNTPEAKAAAVKGGYFEKNKVFAQ